MKKILLVFSLVFCFLLTCSQPFVRVNKETDLLTSKNVIQPRDVCLNQDTIVTVIDINTSLEESGIIVYKNGNEYYISSTYQIYDKDRVYEVVFPDYVRYSASVVGESREDEIFLLKVIVRDKLYCVANTEGNLKTYEADKVSVHSKVEFRETIQVTYVNKVGICKNCGEETYKNFFYSILTLPTSDYSLGAGIYNLNNQLVGMITNYVDDFRYGVSFVDSNRILDVLTKYLTRGEYTKNYIKYNLYNVSQLTTKEKYLYSVDNQNSGVVVASIHYLNYFTLGLNQSMVIIGVNGNRVNNVYEFDYEISKYKKGSYLDLKVRTIVGLYRTIKVKI